VKVGVLALQGAFAAHVGVLRGLGAAASEVRTPQELSDVDALVIPGGESTTMSMTAERGGLLEPLRAWLAEGRPVFGTCAGAILLASEVLDGRADQHCLSAIDISVRRNAYGRQIESFEADLDIAELGPPPFPAVCIRAPRIERVGGDVEVWARLDGDAVLVRSGPVVVATFHPELSGDPRLHDRFLRLCAGAG
jgi:5'-phosphate synthase pdxT subunit